MSLPLVVEHEPVDVPEGANHVLISITLFKQWADENGVEIVEWGEPEQWSGPIYTPVLHRKEAP